MVIACCKCSRHTRKFECPDCQHVLCTSCKEVPEKPRKRPKVTEHSEALNIAHDERRPFTFYIRFNNALEVYPYYAERLPNAQHS
jgi:hypothetical protein